MDSYRQQKVRFSLALSSSATTTAQVAHALTLAGIPKMFSFFKLQSRAYDRTGREVSSEFKPDPDPNPKESSLLSTGSEIPVTHHPQ